MILCYDFTGQIACWGSIGGCDHEEAGDTRPDSRRDPHFVLHSAGLRARVTVAEDVHTCSVMMVMDTTHPSAGYAMPNHQHGT